MPIDYVDAPGMNLKELLKKYNEPGEILFHKLCITMYVRPVFQ